MKIRKLDHLVFYRRSIIELFYLFVIYVDDIVITDNDTSSIEC